LGEALRELEGRRAQLLERSERELRLPFDAGDPGGAEPPRRLGSVLEQRGLADARLAVHDQDTAAPAARGLQQPVEHRELALTAEQPLPRQPRYRPNPRRCPVHLPSEQHDGRDSGRGLRISGIRSPACGGHHACRGIDPVSHKHPDEESSVSAPEPTTGTCGASTSPMEMEVECAQ